MIERITDLLRDVVQALHLEHTSPQGRLCIALNVVLAAVVASCHFWDSVCYAVSRIAGAPPANQPETPILVMMVLAFIAANAAAVLWMHKGMD
ncbi:MAG: hypothetical protein ACP5KN_14405 [Armatimonadota bacterium]